uniref:Zinc-finger domain-containing protein n=2 Tax=Gasterosteus aculeatus aculeatus TaxID=481459 RepID=A0AAQ4NWJ1_GASAC
MSTIRKGLSLAEVFGEDSENERTFYGFSDDEISEHSDKDSNLEVEDEAQPNFSAREQKATTKPSSGVTSFRLRVVLRSTPSAQQFTDEDDDDDDEEEEKRAGRRAGKTSRANKKKRVKFEEVESAVFGPSPSKERGSDSAEDEAASFLTKRERNIKANKAMLAQLMSDLQKMPGGAAILQKQAAKPKTKGRSSRPPRSAAAGGESRRNPERASRRQTRSMGATDDPSAPKEEDLELSLEELLEVRRSPRRRAAPRPKMCKPHCIRPVEDVTEDEIQLVADNMTEKVYNRVTGSTCHQCRQKTVDTKTCCRAEECRGIQGQFCGPCLRNRYGEDVRKALLDPEWKCPPCRGICNCSFCRQRDGRCPTGILFPLAQYHGFSDVHSYLSSLRKKLMSEHNDEVV